MSKKTQSFALICVWVISAAVLAGCDGSDSTSAAGVATPSANTSMSRSVGNSSVTRISAEPVASGSATVSWEAPASNTNGSALTDLSGYRIYYGPSVGDLSNSVQIASVGIQTYVIENLQPGTWYFAIQALASDGTESALSEVVQKTID